MDKRIFAVIAAIAIAALTLGAMLGTSVGQVSLVETPSFRGDYVITVETESGTTVYEIKNTVTTIGKTRVKDFLRTGTVGAVDATKWIALSNDVLDGEGAWTELPGEIVAGTLARAEGTVTNIDETSFKVEKKFTADGTVTVKCVGLHWAASGNSNLWAALAFTETTLNLNDNLTITGTITHN